MFHANKTTSDKKCKLLQALIILLFLVGVLKAHPFFGFNKASWGTSGKNSGKSWSSMLTVDPSNIVSLMIKHGGLLVSKSIDADLKLISKFCHTGECQVNVVEKQLLIRDFSVRLPGSAGQEALRIGRIALRWNSYLKPCVEVEVDDVDVLVEFLNVLLTRNNWDELKAKGFPPTFEEPNEASDSAESVLRIGSILLSGNVNILLTSRPMKKDISTIKFDLKKLGPLYKEIRHKSDENLANLGRRGISTTELYSLIQIYFGRIIQNSLTDTVGDLVADGGKETKERLDRMKETTRGSVSKYVDEATEWTGKEAGKKLAKRLEVWGDSLDKMEEEHKPIFELAKRFGQSKFKDVQKRLLEKNEDESEPDL